MSELLAAVREFLSAPITLGGIDFRFTLSEAVLEFLLPILGYILLALLLRRWAIQAVARLRFFRHWEESDRLRLRRTSGRILRILGIILIASLLGRLLGAQIFAATREVGRILTEPLLESGSTRISMLTILMIIPVFFLAGKLGTAVKRYARSGVLARLDADRQSTISDLLRYTTASAVVLIGMSMLGINLSSLTVLFGVLGIGIGFGLQEVIANVFAGIVIILARPIKDGDRVLSGQHEGTVVNIRLMNTVISTLTGEAIIVPNSTLINKEVYNFSYDSPSIALVNSVQVSYRSDLDEVLEVLRRIPGRNPYALRNAQHQAYVKSFDDSGISVELRTWIRSVYDKMAAHSWVNLEIWRAFRDNGIEIPFPQLDLHVQSADKKL